MAGAYFAELLTRSPGNKEFERFTYQTLAHVALNELRFDQARGVEVKLSARGYGRTYEPARVWADALRECSLPARLAPAAIGG